MLLHVICGLGPPIKNPGYAYGEKPSNSNANPYFHLQQNFLKKNFLDHVFLKKAGFFFKIKTKTKAKKTFTSLGKTAVFSDHAYLRGKICVISLQRVNAKKAKCMQSNDERGLLVKNGERASALL